MDQAYANLVEYEANLDYAYNSLLDQEEALNDSIIADNAETINRLYAPYMSLEYEDPVLAEAYLAAYQEAYDKQYEETYNEVFEQTYNDNSVPTVDENEKYGNLLKKHLTQFMIWSEI